MTTWLTKLKEIGTSVNEYSWRYLDTNDVDRESIPQLPVAEIIAVIEAAEEYCTVCDCADVGCSCEFYKEKKQKEALAALKAKVDDQAL